MLDRDTYLTTKLKISYNTKIKIEIKIKIIEIIKVFIRNGYYLELFFLVIGLKLYIKKDKQINIKLIEYS